MANPFLSGRTFSYIGSTVARGWCYASVQHVGDIESVIPICKWPGRNYPEGTKTVINLHGATPTIFSSLSIHEVERIVRAAGGKIADASHDPYRMADEQYSHSQRGCSPIRILAPRLKIVSGPAG